MADALSIQVEISPGELLDKLTILEIKNARIDAPEKRANIDAELAMLAGIRARDLPATPDIERLTADLKAVNLALWDIEDAIRELERNQDFGPAFIRLARSVYQTNDQRAEIKRAINARLGAKFAEEKSYAGS